jgi:hypothetical protein
MKIKDFIQSLNADETSKILQTLLEENPDLLKKIYNSALRVVGDINEDAIIDEVYHELNALDVETLYSRSGKTRYGYNDPHEAAWEMFEETLYPFINEMGKNQQRILPDVAKTYCIGIIKGLWKYEEKSFFDFKDWVGMHRANMLLLLQKNGKKPTQAIKTLMKF